MRSRLLIDERSKVRADGLPTLPVTDTQGALGVLREAIETFTPSLVVDLLPKSKEPARRRGFRESDAVARGWDQIDIFSCPVNRGEDREKDRLP